MAKRKPIAQGIAGAATSVIQDEPKVAVLKKKMDVAESLEAVGKLKEFADSGKEETHRELSMAFDALGKTLKSVEAWINNISDVQKSIEKKNKK